MTTLRKKIRVKPTEGIVVADKTFADKEPPDKELAREAFAAGREWAWAQKRRTKVEYAAPPPTFEEWWVMQFGEESG
jgi:hypothetical protein